MEETKEYSKERSLEMAKLAVSVLESKKAEDLRVLDISEVSVMADCFVIASGANHNQLHAMCDHLLEKMGHAGFPERHVEGYDQAGWILVDFGDLIVHLFDRENRSLYDLERIWRDGKVLDLESK